jgi:nitroalkane oxidase
MPIDFTLSPEQRALQDGARAFAEGVWAPLSAHIDAMADPAEASYFTRAAFRELAKAGFTKSFIPVADGGLGFGLVDFALAAEELRS